MKNQNSSTQNTLTNQKLERLKTQQAQLCKMLENTNLAIAQEQSEESKENKNIINLKDHAQMLVKSIANTKDKIDLLEQNVFDNDDINFGLIDPQSIELQRNKPEAKRKVNKKKIKSKEKKAFTMEFNNLYTYEIAPDMSSQHIKVILYFRPKAPQDYYFLFWYDGNEKVYKLSSYLHSMGSAQLPDILHVIMDNGNAIEINNFRNYKEGEVELYIKHFTLISKILPSLMSECCYVLYMLSTTYLLTPKGMIKSDSTSFLESFDRPLEILDTKICIERYIHSLEYTQQKKIHSQLKEKGMFSIDLTEDTDEFTMFDQLNKVEKKAIQDFAKLEEDFKKKSYVYEKIQQEEKTRNKDYDKQIKQFDNKGSSLLYLSRDDKVIKIPDTFENQSKIFACKQMQEFIKKVCYTDWRKFSSENQESLQERLNSYKSYLKTGLVDNQTLAECHHFLQAPENQESLKEALDVYKDYLKETGLVDNKTLDKCGDFLQAQEMAYNLLNESVDFIQELNRAETVIAGES